LQLAVQSAGNTKVICAGGKQESSEKLLKDIHDQLTIGGCSGAAIGRNIYQRSLADAVQLAKKISSLVYG
jgi:fructose-bisphosphate aldolase / 6-deoxy-5-ketofructose 1-phosphate synthase